MTSPILLDRRVRSVLSAFAIALAAVLIASTGTHYLSFLKNLETIAGDIRLAALQRPEPQSQDIVVAAITESTLSRFAYRSPVDRAFLADMLEALDKKQPRAIGIDLLFDQPTEIAKDDRLRATLRAMKTPVFVSYSNDPAVVDEDQRAYLDDFVPPEMRAAATLLTDPFDGTVRWTYGGENRVGEPMGFPRRALKAIGRETKRENVEMAWRPRPDAETLPFPMFPVDALTLLPDAWTKDKVVLIGAVLSITDRHRTPLAIVRAGDDGNMPGVLVQAQGVSQLLEGRKHPRMGLFSSLLIDLAAAAIGVGIGFIGRAVPVKIGLGAGVVAAMWICGLLGFRYGLPFVPLVAPTFALAAALWMTDILVGRVERKQRQFVQGAFGRYVSPEVVKQLMDDPSILQVTGSRREATFIFTDIAGFTTLSEALSPERLSEVLNDYLDGACKIVLDHEGTIDKFIGDAIMSIFNAPLDQPDHAARAVRCALELDAYAEAFRIRCNAEGVPIGVTRIGVHCGDSIIGNFGSTQRMDFTALGDTVNTAARTEGVNKYFGTRICCTQSVVDKAPSQSFRPVGDVVLKGKIEAVTLYNPVSAAEVNSGLLADYLAAYGVMATGDPGALSAFRELEKAHVKDPLALFHISRLESGIVGPRIVMDDK